MDTLDNMAKFKMSKLSKKAKVSNLSKLSNRSEAMPAQDPTTPIEERDEADAVLDRPVGEWDDDLATRFMDVRSKRFRAQAEERLRGRAARARAVPMVPLPAPPALPDPGTLLELTPEEEARLTPGLRRFYKRARQHELSRRRHRGRRESNIVNPPFLRRRQAPAAPAPLQNIAPESEPAPDLLGELAPGQEFWGVAPEFVPELTPEQAEAGREAAAGIARALATGVGETASAAVGAMPRAVAGTLATLENLADWGSNEIIRYVYGPEYMSAEPSRTFSSRVPGQHIGAHPDTVLGKMGKGIADLTAAMTLFGALGVMSKAPHLAQKAGPVADALVRALHASGRFGLAEAVLAGNAEQTEAGMVELLGEVAPEYKPVLHAFLTAQDPNDERVWRQFVTGAGTAAAVLPLESLRAVAPIFLAVRGLVGRALSPEEADALIAGGKTGVIPSSTPGKPAVTLEYLSRTD